MKMYEHNKTSNSLIDSNYYVTKLSVITSFLILHTDTHFNYVDCYQNFFEHNPP